METIEVREARLKRELDEAYQAIEEIDEEQASLRGQADEIAGEVAELNAQTETLTQTVAGILVEMEEIERLKARQLPLPFPDIPGGR